MGYDEGFQRELIRLYDAWSPKQEQSKKKKKTKKATASDSDGEASEYDDKSGIRKRAKGVEGSGKEVRYLRAQSKLIGYTEISTDDEKDDGGSE